VAAEILSLPMFPQLTANQQARVAEEVDAFVSQASCTHSELKDMSLETTAKSA
jgi:Mlc titration factor MtfA (ptsG expression regulator)